VKKNILYLSPHFNLASGVSKHVFTLLTSEKLKKEFNLYFITNGGDALSKLDKAKVNYFLMDFKIDKFFHFDFFRNKKQLEGFCAEKEIHLIHSHHRYPEYLAYTIRKSTGIKTVMTVHDFVHGLKYFSYKSDCIIAINNSVKSHLQSIFGLAVDRLFVLYNCLKEKGKFDLRKDNVINLFNIPLDYQIILYLGRIVKEKGIDLLISSFKSLLNEKDKVILIIVGDGKPKMDFLNKEYVNKIKLYSPVENVQEFYEIADIVVLPSSREPFGYTMLEAGLNKIPFVGSKAGGISEFIEDGVNGYLFEPGNSNDLVEKIKFVLDHPVEAKNSAIKLSEKVNRLCNCEDYFTKLSDIYHQLLDDR